MAGPMLDWGADALTRRLAPLLPGLVVEVVERTGSTNTDLLDRARARPDGGVQVRRSVESAAFGRRRSDLEPCLRVAEEQTAGRGRHGRAWRSAAGASLTFSLALPLERADWSGLSLAVGVALCDALDAGTSPASRLRLGLKWPNDLWLADAESGVRGTGRKLGGVLIETVTAGARRHAVVGVGLNVRPVEVDDAGTGVAAWNEIEPAATAPQLLARVAPPLVEALLAFERDGFAPFEARFAARDLLRGCTVRVDAVPPYDGVARGVAANGALRVQAPDGIVDVASGEVRVRPVPGMPAR